MPHLGMGELIIILLIVLVVFGASRLPQLGEGIGKAIAGLKRGLKADDDIDVTPGEKRVGSTSSAESASKVASRDVADAEVVERKT
jgi:sec-independent protein translocase protein TatA